jgi:hypothetical protein
LIIWRSRFTIMDRIKNANEASQKLRKDHCGRLHPGSC